ncbi:MAG: hypothetical protein JWM06_2298, partial [Actinomycetia bacterium]|nr:hypothetical protein [Actinomycetes bacterium]
IVVAVAWIVASRMLRGRTDPRLLRTTWLVLLFASLLANRLRDFNAEVLTTVCVGVGILCLATGRRVGLGWAAIVVGAVNTPAAIIALAPIACLEALRTRQLRHVAPLGIAALLVVVEAWIRRGSPFDTGYGNDHGVATLLPYSGRPGFSYPFLLGVASILFSFGRGLLFFAPGLVLWLDARTRRVVAHHRRALVLMLVFVGGLVVVYAKWWAWYGGISWGPRFFVFAAVPASVLLAFRIRSVGASRLADAATLGVLGLSAWVGVIGLTADISALGVCARGNYSFESFCWYVPEYSSLWQPFLHRPPLTGSTLLVASWCALVFLYLAFPLGRSIFAERFGHADAAWARGWKF